MNAVLNHLLQSTAFALVVAVAAALLRRNSPRLRYWLWMAASLKFLIPFSLLVATGARITLPPDTPSLRAVTVRQVSTYFAPVSSIPEHSTIPWPRLLTAFWLLGASLLAIRWFLRWRTIHLAARRSTRLPLPYPVPVFSSSSAIEPGVFGIHRPILLLPDGITGMLTPAQLDAILAHELCHIRYRDNLTAAIHMCIETLLWFHPLVWWIGAKLTDERERDCDEAVLRQGNLPADYARGIVSVCETYAESPLLCASGITGSDLKMRIREIMRWQGSLPVTRVGKAMLAAAAVAAVSLPFALGILRAQTLPPAPTLTYDAVSIHKSDPAATGAHIGPGPGGGWRTGNTTVLSLMSASYHVQDYQIIDAPRWASNEHYDVIFTPDKSEPPLGDKPSLQQLNSSMDRNSQRMQAVLRDRFGLVLRSETRELPIYNLVQAKSGHKLQPHDPAKRGPSMNLNGGGPGKETQLRGVDITVSFLAQSLSNYLHRPVVDQTHLDSQFDFTVSFTPDTEPSQSDVITSGSLFTALTDQLGLKLESAKGPVQVYVVEKLDHPSEN